MDPIRVSNTWPGRDKDTRLDFLKEEIRVAKLLDHPILGAVVGVQILPISLDFGAWKGWYMKKTQFFGSGK